MAIAQELRDDLGDWIQRRHHRGVKAQGRDAQAIIDDCGVPLHELRCQWELQKQSQMSLQARESDIFT
jgi:hypothetical protein